MLDSYENAEAGPSNMFLPFLFSSPDTISAPQTTAETGFGVSLRMSLGFSYDKCVNLTQLPRSINNVLCPGAGATLKSAD